MYSALMRCFATQKSELGALERGTLNRFIIIALWNFDCVLFVWLDKFEMLLERWIVDICFEEGYS
jgi:hypothetical protein